MNQRRILRGFGFAGPQGLSLRTANLDPGFFGQAYPWLSRTSARDPESVHAWTYRCVKLIGQAVGSTPFRVSMGKSGEPLPESHPVQRLFDRPNPFYSASVFWRQWERSVQLNGRVVVLLDPDAIGYAKGAVPRSMYVMDPDYFQITAVLDDGVTQVIGPGMWSRVREVKRIQDIRGRQYPPHQVIIYEAPEGAPLTAARLSIDADYGAAVYSKSWVANDLNPAGWFEVEQFLTDDEYKQFLEHKRSEHSGPSNAGKAMLLEGGIKWTPNPQTMRDMQWMEGRAHWLEEICAAFGVPKTLLGVTDDLNYATHLGQQRVFWEATILPEMSDIQDAWWSGFFSFVDGGRYWGQFDTSRVAALATDYENRVVQATALSALGVPLNVLNDRFELGLPRVMGGDVGLVAAGLIPLTDAGTPIDIGQPAPITAESVTVPATDNKDGIPAASVDTVQDTAMNGAQVQALQALVQAVSDKTMPAEAAKLIISSAFPALDPAKIEAMVSAAAAFEQAPAEPAPAPGQGSQIVDMIDAAEQIQTDDSGRGLTTLRARSKKQRLAPIVTLRAAIKLRLAIAECEAWLSERASAKARQKWAAFYSRIVLPFERRYARKFQSILHRQKLDVIRQFDAQVKRSHLPVNVRAPEDKIDPKAIKLDPSFWKTEMDRLLRGTYEDLISKALNATAKGDLPVIQVTDPRMTAIIDDRIGDKLVGVNDDTIAEVRATLNRGLDAGKTIADMRRDLAKMPGFSRERARTVAITEMGHASNNSRVEQFAEYDVDEVIWSSVGDAQVRPSHLAAERAGKRKRGETFPNGLRWPHDTNGSAEEVVNCRCGVLAAYE